MAQSSSPKRPSQAQRITSINAQHGVLAVLSPLVLIGLAIMGHLPWAHLSDAMCLALIGDLCGYGLRRYNP